jgi:hypothetical protein
MRCAACLFIGKDNQNDSGLSLGFWSLVRRPGVVYVSGTCRRPNTTRKALLAPSPPRLLNLAFPPRGASEPAYGFILRLSTGSSFGYHPCSRYWQEAGITSIPDLWAKSHFIWRYGFLSGRYESGLGELDD